MVTHESGHASLEHTAFLRSPDSSGIYSLHANCLWMPSARCAQQCHTSLMRLSLTANVQPFMAQIVFVKIRRFCRSDNYWMLPVLWTYWEIKSQSKSHKNLIWWTPLWLRSCLWFAVQREVFVDLLMNWYLWLNRNKDAKTLCQIPVVICNTN